MRESAAGDMFTFILGARNAACLSKPRWETGKGSHARSLEIRNLITPIVIDLGEIRDINCDNLCILAQGSEREGEAEGGMGGR